MYGIAIHFSDNTEELLLYMGISESLSEVERVASTMKDAAFQCGFGDCRYLNEQMEVLTVRDIKPRRLTDEEVSGFWEARQRRIEQMYTAALDRDHSFN